MKKKIMINDNDDDALIDINNYDLYHNYHYHYYCDYHYHCHRTTYETHYFHPKECVVKDGCCSEALAAIKLKHLNNNNATTTNGVLTERKTIGENNTNNTNNNANNTNKKGLSTTTTTTTTDIELDSEMLRCSLTVVVPYSTCLSVTSPSRTLMDTGSVSYPMHKPIIAARDYNSNNTNNNNNNNSNGKGRLIVISSCAIFEDAWLDKEDNNKVMEFAFKFLKPGSQIDLEEKDKKSKSSSSSLIMGGVMDMMSDEIEQHESDVNTPLPDTASLATRLRCCLQESEELPSDFRTLFDSEQFSFNFNCVPDAVELYDKLNVKHAPLTLIPPQFETYALFYFLRV